MTGSRWLLWTALAVAVHLVTVVVVRVIPVPPVPRPQAVSSATVRLRFIDRVPPPARPSSMPWRSDRKASVSRRSHRQERRPATTARLSIPPPSNGPTVAYADLLPGRDWQPSSAPAPVGVLSHGAGVPVAVATAALVAGKLDIPLVFRKGSGTIKAVAKVVHRPELRAQWKFAYVDGEPVLRAVLFEALRDPRNWPAVLQMFRDLSSEEVLLSLRQRTVVTTAQASERYDETYAAAGNKVMIERVHYTGIGAMPVTTPADLLAKAQANLLSIDVPLPDHEADRARWRDRAQLARLEESPAFHAPIRDREP